MDSSQFLTLIGIILIIYTITTDIQQKTLIVKFNLLITTLCIVLFLFLLFLQIRYQYYDIHEPDIKFPVLILNYYFLWKIKFTLLLCNYVLIFIISLLSIYLLLFCNKIYNKRKFIELIKLNIEKNNINFVISLMDFYFENMEKQYSKSKLKFESKYLDNQEGDKLIENAQETFKSDKRNEE